MRFEVPQFIDVEDKIFGPLTLKQFIYLAGGAGLSYVSFKLTPFPIWVILVAAFGGLGLALAFYKVNNRPFIEVAQSFLSFQLKGKLFVWRRPAPRQPTIEKPIAPAAPAQPAREVTGKTINDLAQNLDILDTTNQ